MARRRTIIGLGEALLVEHADGTEPGGLAPLAAMHAVRLGHAGVVVSRIGQDRPGDELCRLLDEAGADTSHLQRDPDLPTGRIIERAIGAPVVRYEEETAAFDNLQADFDLDDVAQEADAVVFGLLTRRSGQTRSEENRFLGACAAAVKLLDLTNHGPQVERGHVLSALEMADAAIIDRAVLDALDPGVSNAPLAESARLWQQRRGLALVLAVERPEAGGAEVRLVAHNARVSAEVRIPDGRSLLAAATIAMLDAMLRGQGIEPALALGARFAAFTVEHPRDRVPDGWRS